MTRGPSPSRAATALARALEDPSPAVAARAARALGSRREASAREALARAARSRRDPVALPAALALLDLGDARGVTAVRALLSRPTLAGDYRLETAMAIVEGRAGRLEEALAHLTRAIADRPDFVRARELAAPILDRLGRGAKAAAQRAKAELFRHDTERPAR